jgi:hypothetical protein
LTLLLNLFLALRLCCKCRLHAAGHRFLDGGDSAQIAGYEREATAISCTVLLTIRNPMCDCGSLAAVAVVGGVAGDGHGWCDVDGAAVVVDAASADVRRICSDGCGAVERCCAVAVDAAALTHGCVPVDRWSPSEVQHFLGHRDPRITLAIYTHINTDDLPTPSALPKPV